MIFDTHTHYDDGAFDADRQELLQSLPAKGVGAVVNVGASMQGAQDTYDLMRKYDFVYGAIGIHPDEVGMLDEAGIRRLRQMLSHEKAVAVGEIGLDYHWNREPRAVQKKWFVAQMRLALELGLPIVVHSRDAAQDTLDCIRESHWGRPGCAGGIIHCFSGSVEMAREYEKLGYHIGVGGVVTFKNARTLKEVVAEVPLWQIVLETDCPYLAPVPKRGERNSSENLPFVASEIARIRGISQEEVERTTWENAVRVYRIDEGAKRRRSAEPEGAQGWKSAASEGAQGRECAMPDRGGRV